ncbi:hypothetical protein MNB_SV-15-504 [hydrothermal vent metagenome]|uniref:Uncharacterized protein n=1 Tax=hydrothermal vent metagenome TaxID=652676 RepID=A0A1W1EJ20_9ZZZZ
MEELADIKGLVEIPDSSIYIYYGLITLAIIVGLVILFFIISKIISLRADKKYKSYIKSLKEIDLSKDVKDGAYKATHFGRLVANSDRKKEIYEQLVEMLEKYKYRKVVDEVDNQTLNQFRLFLQVIDE